jgi:hypothetical protein
MSNISRSGESGSRCAGAVAPAGDNAAVELSWVMPRIYKNRDRRFKTYYWGGIHRSSFVARHLFSAAATIVMARFFASQSVGAAV